jgi:general secretion pathway protein E
MEQMTGEHTKGRSRKGLGQMLVEAELLSPEQLDQALELQRTHNGKLAEVLTEEGLVKAEDVAMMLSLYLNMPLIDLKRHTVQPDALPLVPEETARKHNLIPLDVIGNSLLVVMADPEDIQTIEDLKTQAKMWVEPAVGIPAQIREAINHNYKDSVEIEKQIGQIVGLGEADKAEPILDDLVAEMPIVRTLDLLMAQAVKDRASDVHIEPQGNTLRIRYRIDGILHDKMHLPTSAHAPLISRVKILGGMNIAERKQPQDGQFSLSVVGRGVDVRAATCDTTHGERAVLRILDKSVSLFTLPELGLLPDTLKRYQQMLKSPFGMILVGGPTGSGKTTSLYASLNQLDRNERNILTIEDPVEYRFADINQMQVNAKAGMTFASGLRAIMRHDPDVILVGEVRDTDTAKTAIQAALTGHLVLTSIHANDAVGSLFRLMDLGVEPFLISSAVVGIVAQRMVRRICSQCRNSYQPSLEERIAYDHEMGEGETNFYHGTGCNLCAFTGYWARTGVFEILVMSEEIRRMLLAGAGTDEIRAQALKEGMVPMKLDGMMKVKEGITTTHEVIRNVFSLS